MRTHQCGCYTCAINLTIVRQVKELYKHGLPLSLQGCAKLAVELEKILKEKT